MLGNTLTVLKAYCIIVSITVLL